MTRSALSKQATAAAVAALAAAAPAMAENHHGRSDSDRALEEFLRTAEVVASEEVGEGITHPLRLSLRRGAIEHRAIYKTIDAEIDDIAFTKGLEPRFTDRYAYEVAAYYVDRLVGIGLVPVTVLRTVDGQEGSVQLWIEDITTMERELAENGDAPIENFDLLLQRLMLTYVLDALIYNVDRNHGNILVDFGADRFHPIDHSRAFRLYKKLPPMQDTEIHVPPLVAERLRSLDLAAFQSALDGLLEPNQIKVIDKRRRLLIKELETRGLM